VSRSSRLKNFGLHTDFATWAASRLSSERPLAIAKMPSPPCGPSMPGLQKIHHPNLRRNQLDNHDNHLKELLTEALTGLRDAVPETVISVAERMGRINSVYVRTERDEHLEEAVRSLIGNALAELEGKSDKRRVLFVIGESGSGKTTAIRKHIADNPAFQPRTTVDGEIVRPMISIDAPTPMTIKLLAKTGLEAIGYPAPPNMQENAIWDLFKRQLRERRVLFFHIDEMQHVMRGNTQKAIQDAADLIKGLTQIEGWPLHLILSGVPQLISFLDRSNTAEKKNQLGNRKTIVNFEDMRFPDHVPHMRAIVGHIVTEDAGLKVNGITTDDAIHRLIHSMSGGFGTMIQFVRAAIEDVLYQGGNSVTIENFARTYSKFSGCFPSQNIFFAEQFEEIEPGNALAWLNPDKSYGTMQYKRKGHKR
jgi:hypothetical protein